MQQIKPFVFKDPKDPIAFMKELSKKTRLDAEFYMKQLPDLVNKFGNIELLEHLQEVGIVLDHQQAVGCKCRKNCTCVVKREDFNNEVQKKYVSMINNIKTKFKKEEAQKGDKF